MTQTPLVPVEKVAEHFTVTVSCIRGWVRLGKIPKSTYIKVGNTYRFNIPAIVDALTAIPDEEVKPVDVAPVSDIPAPVQLELDFNSDDDI